MQNNDPNNKDTPKRESQNKDKSERIAKFLARAGIASRRDAEKLIEAGRIKVNGTVLTTPAFKVSPRDKVSFDGALVRKDPPRLWRYHKPPGLMTTHKDPEGRPTVFDMLSKDMPRVISIGRLDMTSEGLLLLTNDGDLARALELPSTGWIRRYKARAFGKVTQEDLDTLIDGIDIDGIPTGPIEAKLERQQRGNAWITVTIREGKNREVRRALDSLGLKVNRLIRTTYGPFQLGVLEKGQVEEVKNRILRDQVGHMVDIPKIEDKPSRANLDQNKDQPKGRSKGKRGQSKSKTNQYSTKRRPQNAKAFGAKDNRSKPGNSKPKAQRPSGKRFGKPSSTRRGRK